MNLISDMIQRPDQQRLQCGLLMRFWRNNAGASAVEFAMILPFMLVLLIGTIELTDALDKDRKVSRIANSITDLVAQAQTVTTAQIDSVRTLGRVLLAPYPTDQLNTIIASVTFNGDGEPEVDWVHPATSGWTKGAPPPITLPDTLVAPNTSIVVGQANLAYVSPFVGVFTKYFTRATSFNLSDTFYLRPRLTSTVDCTNCP